MKELKSVSGKANLLGGIIVAALIGATVIQDILTLFLNFVLSLLEREQIPNVSDTLIAFLVGFLLLYFYCSVKVIPDE